jgi:hypothetical protein
VLAENIRFTLHGKGTKPYEENKFFLQQVQRGLAKKAPPPLKIVEWSAFSVPARQQKWP